MQNALICSLSPYFVGILFSQIQIATAMCVYRCSFSTLFSIVLVLSVLLFRSFVCALWLYIVPCSGSLIMVVIFERNCECAIDVKSVIRFAVAFFVDGAFADILVQCLNTNCEYRASTAFLIMWFFFAHTNDLVYTCTAAHTSTNQMLCLLFMAVIERSPLYMLCSCYIRYRTFTIRCYRYE